MEQLIIKVKDEAESSFLKDLLKKLKIQFKSVGEDEIVSDEDVKQSVINGQLAYKSGDSDQFTTIASKDIWK